jgi:O-antigen/teichoic acid export membrane protein
VSGSGTAGEEGPLRLSRARRNAVAAVVAQGIGVGASLLTVPIVTGYLGPAEYGVFLTLSSLLVWLSVADLGLSGNAFVQIIATAAARGGCDDVQRTTSSTFFGLGLIALVLGISTLMFEPMIPWSVVFNTQSNVSAAELSAALRVSLLLFVSALPLGIGSAALIAHQEAHLAHAWSLAGNLLGVALLSLAVVADCGLWGVAAAFLLARGMSSLGACAHAVYRRPWLLPRLHMASLAELHRIAPLSLKAIGAQVAGLGQFQSQALLVSHMANPAEVGVFNLSYRILTLPLLAVQLASTPLMPAIADAYARRDLPWAWAVLRRYTWWAILLTATLTFSGHLWLAPVVRQVAGAPYVPPPALVMVLAFYAVVAAGVTPSSVFLYGVGRIGGQAAYAWVNALLAVPLMFLLTARLGITGTALGMTLALAAVNPAAQWFELRRFERVSGRRRVAT